MADSDTTADSSGTAGATEPEYSFDGFELQFSFKVALTPPMKSAATVAVAPGGAR
jgi:hypothetical protein